MHIGCNIRGTFLNLLAYVDDIVPIAPSWFALQKLLTALNVEATAVNMSFNTKKMVRILFNPKQRCKIVSSNFPLFTLARCELVFIEKFKYLRHIIENGLFDNADINREIKYLYTRRNILIRRF
ncbi:uncharacterized protein LOC136076238 [Hydra vulgaris]|uniref:Uncharacterized protein LOC136076238 n=1 Tax=Hydra vulgaris TaxID=6087 RepID=A0ABM4BA66_HYDVU